MAYQSLNPYDGTIHATFEELTDKRLESAIRAAQECSETWRQTAFAGLAVILKRAAAILRARWEEFARLITLEMGKLIGESRGEVAAVIADPRIKGVALTGSEAAGTIVADRSLEKFMTAMAGLKWEIP